MLCERPHGWVYGVVGTPPAKRLTLNLRSTFSCIRVFDSSAAASTLVTGFRGLGVECQAYGFGVQQALDFCGVFRVRGVAGFLQFLSVSRSEERRVGTDV